MATKTNDGQQPAVQLTMNEKFFRYFQHEVTDLQEQMGRVEKMTTLGGERADAIDHCLSAISRLSTEVQEASAYIPAYDQRTYGEAVKALNNKLQEVRASSAPKAKFSFKKSGGLVFTAKKNESAISINDAAELAKQRRKYVSSSGHPLSDHSSGVSSYTNTPADLGTPANEPSDEEAPGGGAPASELPEPANPAGVLVHAAFSKNNTLTIANHTNTHIVLSPSGASSPGRSSSSGTISNLTRCVVDLSRPAEVASQAGQAHPTFTSLTLKSLSSSLLHLPAIAGPAHLTDLHNCVLLVSCAQFRLHASTDCTVYLRVTSRPIVEDCEDVRFAELGAEEEEGSGTAERDGQEAGQGQKVAKNLWSQVQDFNWHKASPSPHWRVLEAGERVEERVWREVLGSGATTATATGGDGKEVEEILQTIGVLPR